MWMKDTSPGDYARFVEYLNDMYKSSLSIVKVDSLDITYHYLIKDAGSIPRLVAKQSPGHWSVLDLLS